MKGESGFELLDEEQRKLLRLLASGLLQKQVADQLGVKPVTIEKRLEKIRGLVGVARSDSAARAFVAYEARSASYGPPIYGPEPLLSPVISTPSPVEPPTEVPTLRDTRPRFEVLAPPPSRLRWIRQTGDRNNDLNFGERLIAIAALSAASLTIATAAVIAVVLLMNFLIGVARHSG